MPLKVAILEDDPAQSQIIELWLPPAEYTCQCYATGQALLDALKVETFDILLIDWQLPDINGPDVMLIIRNEMNNDLPIIFITNRDSEEDIVKVLSTGADDYLVKPIRQFEFLARVKANSRRLATGVSNKDDNRYLPYAFNPETQQVMLKNELIELSSKEFDLAYFIFRNEGKLLNRKDILSQVWQQDADLNTRTVDTHMSIIRKKLVLNPENGWRLKSVYGHGYRLERLT